MVKMDIGGNIDSFIKGRGKSKGRLPNERYSSFDYCFNYFRSFYESDRVNELASKDNIQLSCLQLGFYLASWRMLRGSSFLLQKSVKHYENLIKTISKIDGKFWEIDVDRYNDENIALLLRCKDIIKDALGEDKDPSDILISKIMLGVFSNVPAFDNFFRNGMRKIGIKVDGINEKSLKKIYNFYLENKKEIDDFKISTISFSTGENTNRFYTKAKIIDMIGFIEGGGES